MPIQTFDDFDNEEYRLGELPPFQFRKDKTEKGTLEWLNDNFTAKYEGASSRFFVYRRHFAMYKNTVEDIVGGTGYAYTANRDQPLPTKKPKVRMNFAYENIETKVSQVSRRKVNVTVVPNNDSEQDDINNAKAAKLLLTSRAEEIDLDGIMREADRKTFLLGHTFTEVCWDKNEGPISPEWEKQARLNAAINDGEYGVPILDDEGKPTGKMEKEPLRVGDVKVKVWMPINCFPERGKTEWCELNEFETIEWYHIDELKAMYPGKKNKIEDGNDRVYYDVERNMTYVPDDYKMVRTFWHRPTKFYPEGCKIVYCDDCILSWDDFPYEDQQLPFIPDKDVEVPGEFWGRSFLINTEQLIRFYNNILSGQARNHGVGSAPKWVYPEGSVDQKQLNNEYGGISFRGPQAPQLVSYAYQDKYGGDTQKFLGERINAMAGIFLTSQGLVPPGVTAASAIRYLDEQEQQRNSNTIAKRNRRVLGVYRMMLSRMRQYYSATDGRMVHLLGENNDYLIKSFEKMDFNSIYDVRLENAPWISDTKSGAIADIIDLNASNQKDPLFRREEMVQILGLGLAKGFKDQVSYAVDTARTVLEMCMEGKMPPAPEETDNLLVFLSVFYKYVESPAYKFKLDENRKQITKDYILAVEMLAWEMSQKNPKFAMELSRFEKYPIFWEAPVDNTMPAQPTPGMPQAAPGMDTTAMPNTQEQVEQVNQEVNDQQGELNA